MHTAQIVWALAGLVVLLYAVWRVWIWKSSPIRFRAILPPSNHLSWWATSARPSVLSQAGSPPQLGLPTEIGPLRKESPTGANQSTIASGPGHLGVAAATLDGALTGFHAAEALASIHIDFLKAIQESTAEHLHNLHSVSEYVQDHFFDAPADSADGWLHRLEGYVGEQKAAVALEHAGHAVQFAPHANQAGWDLLVDGHAVQIKEGITAAANAKEALVTHPDIPVYTDLQSAADLKDGMVHGLAELDPDAISSATESSLSGIQEGLSPDFSIPVVTLLRSSWREFKLLDDGKTSIERALTNVTVDVGGVGAGAWVGTKAGLMAGAACPPAAPFLAILGAIAGAIVGRKLADNIRKGPFKKAWEEFCRIHKDASAETEGAIVNSRRKVQELGIEYERKFDSARRAVELTARKQLSEVEREMTIRLESFLKNFPNHLSNLEAQLENEERMVLGQMPSTHWWNWFFPSEDLRKSAIRRWFRSARRIVNEERVRLEAMSASPVSTLRIEVEHFLSTYVFSLQSLDASLAALVKHFGRAQENATRIRERAARQAEQERNALLVAFRDEIVKLHSALAHTFSLWRSRLEHSLALLRKEAESVGVELPS